MTAGERFKNWIDETAAGWKDRLRGWMMSWLESGLLSLFEAREPEIIALTKETIDKIKEQPDLPVEIQTLLGKTTETGKIFDVFAGYVFAILGILPAAMGIGAPTGRQMEYNAERVVKSARIDPRTLITAWRRDPATYQQWFDDLRDLGWSEERIEVLKFATLVYPSRQDGIRYVAKEALEPEAIDKYGLMAEFDRIDLSLFKQIGVPEETVRLDWIAHWEHASWMQIVEMLHRGLITEQDVYDWFRLVEIPPFWRGLLIQTAYTWPTRVDVRRWWDMRTIDETELRRLYSGMGYRGDNLDNYVLWTKVYVAFPDLMARWTKGWITIDDVRTELVALGMPAERVEEMIQMKIKPQEPERVEEGKSLTKTEIYKGVKKGVITWEEGIELLMDLGYDYDEADYILTINVEALAGSPETFEEFKGITQKYKVATGREAKPMPEEIKKAADEVVKLTGEVEALERSIVEEKRGLVDQEVLPEETTKRLKTLQVKRNRAESKLSAAKSEYERLVAEWRHALP